MELHGGQILDGEVLDGGAQERGAVFSAIDPATGAALAPAFRSATPAHVDRAMRAAAAAFPALRALPGPRRADFLERAAARIGELGATLIDRTHAETGLPRPRLEGERDRTLLQLRVFADMARAESWRGPRIDRARPERKPAPRPDLRSMNVAIGPVVVFGASNFPLAISVAGTDTIAALAVGCPVVVKAHPAHPGASELVGRCLAEAARDTGMPAGSFAMLHGTSPDVGLGLVRHPAARAVAFTGSLAGGRALFDAAAARPDPIPVYAEMGSLNPVLLLPGALADRAEAIAAAYLQSVNLGAGQMCTKPGLAFGFRSPAFERFKAAVAAGVPAIPPATMLHAGIRKAYAAGVERVTGTPGVTLLAAASGADPARTQAACAVFALDAEALARAPVLLEENFGPSSLVITCSTRTELQAAIERMDGHLAASVHATPDDLREHADLLALLETKVGRIVLNGFSTGLEVVPALHHGGPYPATTHAAFTSVGHAAFLRFVRPLAYQGWPSAALPAPLRDENPLGLTRLVDGRLTREPS